MRKTGRAFQLKLCCPRCGSPAREDGFVGHTYFCLCGWSITKKKPEESIISTISLAMIGSLLLASAVWLFLLNEPSQSIAFLNQKISGIIQLYK